MGQVYRSVHATFWTGRTGRQVRASGPKCQVLALYVVTSPHANMIGLYYLPMAYICTDTGLCDKDARSALETLQGLNFLRYDHDSEWVWVCAAVTYQVGANANRVAGARALYDGSDNTLLKQAFWERYHDALDLGDPPAGVARKPLPSDSVVDGGIEKEKEKETEKETERAADAAPRPSAQAFADAWNEDTTPPIARCRELTDKRRKQAMARLRERPLEEWRPIFQRINASDFCRGQNDRGWIATFDWALQPDTAAKVLEGKYDNRTKVVSAADARAASLKREREAWLNRNKGASDDAA
jgi:hypothetical protein